VSGAAVVAALLALAACGGGNDAANPQVASLPTTSASGAAVPPPATSSVAVGRPQERLDDTPERHEALIDAWDACLAAHGATYGGTGVAGGRSLKEPIPTAAKNACTDKLPIGPPELDPSQNLHYRDDMVAEISCLRAHGDKVHLTSDTSVYPNGLGWTYDDNATTPANEGQIEDACQLAAFGDK
jgi:hypothetical protein